MAAVASGVGRVRPAVTAEHRAAVAEVLAVPGAINVAVAADRLVAVAVEAVVVHGRIAGADRASTKRASSVRRRSRCRRLT